jgi:hypothetical protein
MADSLRLVYITEAFKSSRSTLLFYTPRRSPHFPPGFFEVLTKLGNRQITEVSLHQEPFIKAHGGIMLDARVRVAQLAKTDKEGVIRVGAGKPAHFEWICDPETWMNFSYLVDGLSGGHQYLTAGPSEDAMVMVSQGEYYDEDFENLE